MGSSDKFKKLYNHFLKMYEHITKEGCDLQWDTPNALINTDLEPAIVFYLGDIHMIISKKSSLEIIF